MYIKKIESNANYSLFFLCFRPPVLSCMPEKILSNFTFKDIIQSELPEVSELVSFVSYNIATGLQNVKSKRADKTFLQLFQEYNDWK